MSRAHEVDWCNTYECDGPATEDPDEPGTCDECGQPLVRVKVMRADVAQAAIERAEGRADALLDENLALRARTDELVRELERRPSRGQS